jgi:hypothetical protein
MQLCYSVFKRKHPRWLFRNQKLQNKEESIMPKSIRYCLYLALFLGLTGCSDPVKQVVEQNMKGLQKQDINQVMSTIDSRSPVYAATEKQLTQLLQDYNIDFKIESIDVLERPKDVKKSYKAETPAENVDIFAEDLDFITEEDKAAADKARRQREMDDKNKPWVAKVKVTQFARQKKGANPFLNNRVVVIHTLHKYPTDEKPTWKIYQSDIRDVEFLVGQQG